MGVTMKSSTEARFREVMMVEPPDDGEVDDAQLERLFGELWSRPGLGRRERRLVTITCLAYAVTAQPIYDHAYAAFKSADLSIDEMLEVVLHFAVYCGWPKASNLEMYVRMAWAQVQVDAGGTAEPLPPQDNDELGINEWAARIERGAEEFRDVNLVDAPPTDTPYQHAGILNFVFGHVWQRPKLGRRDRRFVTVACVGLCEAPIPIESHVTSALKSGDITPAEMDELIVQVRAYDTDHRADLLSAAALQASAG
jgi:4-carboxymuconolactone decarboxylase